ncbi:hypothetical protein H4R99_007853 [Coemansia sp. RSA 1722]|nr:hypothetical protein IWW45_002168 [Coemansia sp. RSA 485]KAJ2588275.1 hypothetical protein H4R99_007853 [Coemansia sp. RSA 1722]
MMDYSPEKQGPSKHIRDIVDWPQLDEWLKALYAPDAPPVISQRTAETQAQLSQLHHLEKCIRSARNIVQRIQSEASTEYQGLSDQIAAILNTANISSSALPKPTSLALSSLSKLASTLALPNMRPESFERAISRMTIDGFRRQTQVSDLRDKRNELLKKTEESRERQRKLVILLDGRKQDSVVEQQKAREWMRNAQVIAHKSEEYEQRLEELGRERRKRGELHEYQELKNLDDRVNNLRKDVDDKQRALEGYSALPPDISLAYLKLEEAKQALDQLRIDCEDAVAAAFN